LAKQLRLPGFRQDQPRGGAVEAGREKKAKKAGWHLTLGLKETIFAGVGIVGLMMMSFALGALAGRGDIYRVAYSWGLMNPEPAKVAPWAFAPGLPSTAMPAASGTASAPTVAAPATPAVPAAAPPGPAAVPATPAPLAAKPDQAGPVTGAIVPAPAPESTKKKAKTGTLTRDQQSREEELRQVRQEMVKKFKFQNSFDTGPKPRLPKSKDQEKAHAKAQASQVQVAQFRNGKEAQAKVAELQKKGVKASLKKTKDAKGPLYIVCKPGNPAPAPGDKPAPKPDKSGAAIPTPKPQ